jgi:hypothetical protein
MPAWEAGGPLGTPGGTGRLEGCSRPSCQTQGQPASANSIATLFVCPTTPHAVDCWRPCSVPWRAVAVALLLIGMAAPGLEAFVGCSEDCPDDFQGRVRRRHVLFLLHVRPSGHADRRLSCFALLPPILPRSATGRRDPARRRHRPPPRPQSGSSLEPRFVRPGSGASAGACPLRSHASPCRHLSSIGSDRPGRQDLGRGAPVTRRRIGTRTDKLPRRDCRADKGRGGAGPPPRCGAATR